MYASFVRDNHGMLDFGCNGYGGLAIGDSHPAYALHALDNNDELYDSENDGASTLATDNEQCDNISQSSFLRVTDDMHQGCRGILILEKISELQANSREQNMTNEKESPSGTTRFITEHNLARFWRRAGLYPHSCGLSIPLIELSNLYDVGIRNRPPGNLRFDTPLVRRWQRNLLAGEWVEGSPNQMRLWAVNDMSDHRALFSLSLRIVNASADDKLVRVHAPSMEMALRTRLDLPADALQLRAFRANAVQHKVFVRTKRSLLIADTARQEITSIFSGCVRHFSQIAHTDDEIAIADAAGFAFWGAYGTPLARIKSNLDVQYVAATDCPRIVLLMGEREIVQHDLRAPGAVETSVFTLERAVPEARTVILPLSSYAYVRKRERFWHLNAVDVSAETFIATTSYRHFVFDRRMLNQPISTMPHSLIDGADYCQITDPLFDPITGGLVYSVYTLAHVIRPAVSHWALMFHPLEQIWSSMGAAYELSAPTELLKFTGYHSGFAIGLSSDHLNKLPSFTRALYYQRLPDTFGCESNKRSILFRQMEGGEIFYENVLFDFTSKSKADEESEKPRQSSSSFFNFDSVLENNENDSHFQINQSVLGYSLKLDALDAIRSYYQKRRKIYAENANAYTRDVDEDYLVPSTSLVQNVNCFKIFRRNTKASPKSVSLINPFSTINVVADVSVDAFSNAELVNSVEDDDGRLFSEIIINNWKKAAGEMVELLEKQHNTLPEIESIAVINNINMDEDNEPQRTDNIFDLFNSCNEFQN